MQRNLGAVPPGSTKWPAPHAGPARGGEPLLCVEPWSRHFGDVKLEFRYQLGPEVSTSE